VVGELFANEVSRRGLAGLVLDGYCRDSRSVQQVNLPIFVRGATPHAATAKAAPSVNIPLTIEGVRVNPGDLLAGDEDGIPVTTADELTAVVHAAETIQFTEEALVSSMTDGVSLFNKLNFAEHVRKVSASQDSSLQFLV
jgi:4-hydroxy-4-methyl-2-oxoglutarate aldolase